MKHLKKLTVAIISLILITLSTSCTTIRIDASEFDWETFPDPIQNGKSVVMYDENTDTVSMPLEYWKQIMNYVVCTESNISLITKN